MKLRTGKWVETLLARAGRKGRTTANLALLGVSCTYTGNGLRARRIPLGNTAWSSLNMTPSPRR